MDAHFVDTRARRTVPNRALESFDRIGVAFGGDLDAAIRQVAHPAGHRFALGRPDSEEAEADPLHASGDEIAARDPQGSV